MRKFGLLGSSALRSLCVYRSFHGARDARLCAGSRRGRRRRRRAPSAQSEAEIESGTEATAEPPARRSSVTGSRIRRPNLESADADHLGRRRRSYRDRRRLARRRAERAAAAAHHVQPGELDPLPRHRRPQPARSSRPRHAAHPGAGQRPPPRRRRRPRQRTVAGHQHDPDRSVERVDVVTGGNSAIYGSDAVAGVVNFILRRDFDGFRLRGQGGVSSRGDRGSYFVSLTAGQNFADDRGNVAVAAEYAKAEHALLRRSRRPDRRLPRPHAQLHASSQSHDPRLDPTGDDPTGVRTADRRRHSRHDVPHPASATTASRDGGLFTAACPTAAATGTRPRRSRSVGNWPATAPDSGSPNALAQFGRTFVFDRRNAGRATTAAQDFAAVRQRQLRRRPRLDAASRPACCRRASSASRQPRSRTSTCAGLRALPRSEICPRRLPTRQRSADLLRPTRRSLRSTTRS